MLRIIVFLLSLFVIGFLIVHDNWMITISGFGYEATVSTVLLGCSFVLLLYIIHLLKKPLVWFGLVQHKISASRYAKREAYLTKVLQFVLEDNPKEGKALLKQKKGIFDKNDVKGLMIQAILDPDKRVFEEMLKHGETELSGLRGLYCEALQTGDLRRQGKILHAASEKYADVSWVAEGQYLLAVKESIWADALAALENLRKEGFIAKDAYLDRKADLLMKNNQPEEAFKLKPKNPLFALAAAEKQPEKSAEILTKSWKETPSKAVYEAYMLLYSKETPQKQMKHLKKLIAGNENSKEALMALADASTRLEMYLDAKEALDIYLAAYPLTKSAALLMAKIVREGWHHEEEAKEWEKKAVEAVDLPHWVCVNCRREVLDWDVSCPHCNALHQITYR